MYNKLRKKCPRCGNDTFEVTGHITQDWLVDSKGDFISVTTDCIDVTHRPDDDDIWSCFKCGHSAPGKEFNGVVAFTWDDLYKLAIDKPSNSLEMKVKDEARSQIHDAILKDTGIDIDSSESPEEAIDGYLSKHYAVFDERGNLLSCERREKE